jgi:hypothetical protein
MPGLMLSVTIRKQAVSCRAIRAQLAFSVRCNNFSHRKYVQCLGLFEN